MANQQTELTRIQQLKQELRFAGVTRYGMMKFAVRYLPKIIHEDEHIMGVVYGRYQDRQSKNKWNEGMLVATEARILFVDHKPGFTNVEDISYAVVSAVNLSTALFSAVTLHTKLGDFELRFANAKCSKNFVQYVENRQLQTKPLK